jgi:hypothetical protein
MEDRMTPAQQIEIKRYLKEGFSPASIARKFRDVSTEDVIAFKRNGYVWEKSAKDTWIPRTWHLPRNMAEQVEAEVREIADLPAEERIKKLMVIKAVYGC